MSGTPKNTTTIESTTSTSDFRQELIEPRQLAAQLGMSLRTLQRHHDARTGPPRINLGKHVFYRRATVDAWLKACEGYGQGGGTSRKPVNRAARTRNARRVRRAA
ncbi:MAG: helix-turn-helix transcriptional regulator [Terracidiphilus sp.]